MSQQPAPLSPPAKVARVLIAAVLLTLLVYICAQVFLGRGVLPVNPEDNRSESTPPEAPAAETGNREEPVPEIPDGRPAAPSATTSERTPRPATSQPPAEGWEMQVCKDGTARVLHLGAPVLSANWNFWGENWKWLGRSVTLNHEGPDRKSLYVHVPELELGITVMIESGPPNVLLYRFMMESKRTISGITGGGLDFSLALDSPSFPGKPAVPVILPDNRGWTWDTGSGATRVEFSRPMPSVDFERHGNIKCIRALLVGTDLPKGLQTFDMTVALPEGADLIPSVSERYGPAMTDMWHAGVLNADASPVDLSFLNHTPAGAKGFVRADGDALVFEDGTPARFWGGNLAGYALFRPNQEIEAHARRIAQLGYNLMRIHHHDSKWVKPNVIDNSRDDTQHLDLDAMDRLDYLVKCLKEHGVYVWLDLHVGRVLKEGDVHSTHGTIEGFDEIARCKGEVKGFCYFNETVQALMTDFNAKYLSHVNPYTGLAYKDDPAVMGAQITNENDLTLHFGNLMLPANNNPVHNEIFEQLVSEFAGKHGLNRQRTWQTWVPGPSKIFLNDRENQFNSRMIDDLRNAGCRMPISTTSYWASLSSFSLPALTAGDLIDVHSYGKSEAFDSNPRYVSNYVSRIAGAHVCGKPLSVSEWNVPYPEADRFTAPLYVASIACLQGWDAMMIYAYSFERLAKPSRPSTWSSYADPALTIMMPAAALAFRQQHISPARTSYCLKLNREGTCYQGIDSASSATIRTLAETSALTIGLPDFPELDWDSEALPVPGASVRVLTDPSRDFIPDGQDYVESDTGELKRDWGRGVHTINSANTQSASGWIGGKTISMRDVRIQTSTRKAVVVVTSLEDCPISESRRILVTSMARVVTPGQKLPYLAEPVVGTVWITAPPGLRVRPVEPDGSTGEAFAAEHVEGVYQIALDAVAWRPCLILE